MDRPDRAPLFAIIVILLSMIAAGCKSGQQKESGWWPFAKKTDSVPGITPPPERIKAIRATAKNAATSDPAEQQRIIAEFTELYRRDPDPVIRGELVRAAGNTPSPAAVLLLGEAIKDTDADVRVAACQGLSKHNGPDAAGVLREALTSDTDPDVRLTAAKALGRHRDPATIAALGAALEDRNPAMQYQAVTSLRTAAAQDLGNDVERWRAYVKNEPPPASKPISVAAQVRSMF